MNLSAFLFADEHLPTLTLSTIKIEITSISNKKITNGDVADKPTKAHSYQRDKM